MDVEPPRTYPRSHMTIISPEHSICFWPILKCASTTMRRYLVTDPTFLAGKHDITEAEEYEHQFAIVRDPVSRWVSACNTARRANLKRKVRAWERFLADALAEIRAGRRFTDGGNPHFAPQVDFIPDSNVTLFPIEMIGQPITEWLWERGAEVSADWPHDQSMGDGHRDHARSQLTAEDRAFIYAWYADDLLLHREAMNVYALS